MAKINAKIRPTYSVNTGGINSTYVEVEIFILGEIKLLYSQERIKLRIWINGKISRDQRYTSWTADFPTSWTRTRITFFHNLALRNQSQVVSYLSDILQRMNTVHDKAVSEVKRRMGVHFHFIHKMVPHVHRQTRQSIFTDDVTRLKLDTARMKTSMQWPQIQLLLSVFCTHLCNVTR